MSGRLQVLKKRMEREKGILRRVESLVKDNMVRLNLRVAYCTASIMPLKKWLQTMHLRRKHDKIHDIEPSPAVKKY